MARPVQTFFPKAALRVARGALGGRVARALVALGFPLAPFQRKWLRDAYGPQTEVAALSAPRGSGKSCFLGTVAALGLRPGSPTFQPGIENLAVSASLEQGRILLGFARDALEDVEADYRFLDSSQRLAITHKPSGTRLRVLSSSGKRAMGLSRFREIYFDEPNSLETRGGALLFDAVRQSLGKRAQQRLFLVGTRSPAEPGTWWPALLDGGSGPGTHVTVLAAPDNAPWDAWPTIRACNPLILRNPSLRKTILRERDEARRAGGSSLRRSFEAYRLNRLLQPSQEMLCEVSEWQAVERREVPPRVGRPFVGLDLGSSRSWSAAWAIWPNGRSECWAVCPGIPGLAARERQDAQPRGLYQRLAESGALIVDEGLRVSRPETLISHLLAVGVEPEFILCDRFMLPQLRDAVAGRWPIQARVTRWSDATEDIMAFRQLVKDGPLSIAPESRALAAASLAQAAVASDDQGSVRLQKARRGRSRDDVAVSGTLSAGALSRSLRAPQRARWRFAVA